MPELTDYNLTSITSGLQLYEGNFSYIIKEFKSLSLIASNYILFGEKYWQTYGNLNLPMLLAELFYYE